MIVCQRCGTENDAVATFCRNPTCRDYLWSREYARDATDTEPLPATAGPAQQPAGREEGAARDLFVGLAVPRAQPPREPGAAISLWGHPSALEVEPGEEATVEFRVRNGGTVVDQIAVTAEGDAAAWTTVTPPSANVYPGDTATGVITLRPPRAPNVRAGRVRLVLRARSSENPAITATCAVSVTVRRFHEMTGTLVPREATARRARHVLTLTNAGNASLEPSIRVVEENNAVTAAVEPGFATLSPGYSQHVDVRVRPRRRNWIGSAQTYRYRVVAQEKDAPPLELDAALTQRPVIPGWAARLAAVAIPLAAAVLAFVLLWTKVPEVEGMKEAAALEELEAAGLEAELVRQHNTRVAAGTVVETDPGAGDRIREGSQVKVVVSSGPRPVPIPNVVGLDAATARHELGGMGLSVEEVVEETTEVEPGLVVSTRPAANLLVPPGTAVEMVVAEAPGEERGKGGEDDPAGGGEDEEDEAAGEDEDEGNDAAGDRPRTPYWTSSVASNDFDGDGRADLAVFRPSTGAWHVRPAPGRNQSADWRRQRGSDIPVPGDYDGDGDADLATWRPSDATWYVRYSGSQRHTIVELGRPGDIPVPADYDGDGTTDLAVFGSEDGRWRIDPSSGDRSAVSQVEWGDRERGDLPVPSDYDGDGKADLAVYRATDGHWKVVLSGGRRADVKWGDATAGDIPVPGDYDGDGRSDFAVWRAQTGEWRVRTTGRGANVFLTWGRRDLLDVPVPGDYTGDGRVDFAIWRESTRAWRIQPAGGRRHRVSYWGREGDIPL
ncbi:MAG: PASTA domain-containing protein [Actinomycetota bacterium]|nr:PASTA domain-containing protein [Actinomycetota bacterium]